MQEKIKVRDYELIQNIHILFEKPIIILGAGHLGKKICGLLQEVPIIVNYIYDKALKENICMGVPVISFEEVKEVAQKEEYLIVIGTENYREELLSELEKNEIQGYICTWYGVQAAIELNINSVVFKQNFREDFSQRKNLAKSSQNLYVYFKWMKEIYEYPQAILVWNLKKVGSMTISKTLDVEGIKNIHIHNFINLKDDDIGVLNIKRNNADYLKKYLIKNKNILKIITLIREPIGQALSDFMQSFTQLGIGFDMDKNILKSAEIYVVENVGSNYEFRWFDEEIKKLTKVDIFQYPFNKEQGYSWIKKDNIEILVLKMEQMNENTNIIGQFVGKTDLRLVNANIGSEKHYKYIYEEVKKRFRIPAEVLKEQYTNNSRLDHFYTEDEKQRFWEKWKNNIE